MTNQSVDVRLLQNQYASLERELEALKKKGGTPPGGDDLEPRVARLESDVEYIKRDIGEIKTDIREIGSDVATIKIMIGTFGGALTVALGILAWVANNRFDSIISLLSK